MNVQAEYRKLLTADGASGAPDHFQALSRQFAEQKLWRSYDWLLAMLPRPLTGAVAVDIGCKYGHVLPLFLARGAKHAIGIDVEDEYLETGECIFGPLYPDIHFAKSDRGFLPLAPDSTDVVLVNEVISHVNPAYLETLYAEIARILRLGGAVLVSDGNNIANADCRRALLDVYDAWENGPAGRKTDRDQVIQPFVELRRAIIRERHPELPAKTVDYLARNTFGLFGDYLLETVDGYVRSGKLVERPFRPGLCPTNPRPSGVVMERGFHPQQVELALAGYGLKSEQVLPPPRVARADLLGRALNLALAARHRLRRWLAPERLRGQSWGFQVLAVKEG